MEMKFDPMTGEPIEPQQDAVRFDPMTGEPIQQGAQEQPVQPQGTITGYDPMTGQPIYAGSNATFTAPPAAKTGMGIGAKIGIAVAAVAVIGCVAIAGAKSGAFLGASGKVKLAATKTIAEEPAILDAVNVSSILSSGSWTLGAEASYSGQSIKGEYRYSDKKQQLEATVDIAGASELTAYVTLDKEALYLAVPEMLDDTLVYYYTKDNDGALIDAMGDDNVEQINQLLQEAASGKKTPKEAEEFVQALKDEYKSLKYKKISSKEFEVDGKERKCKGYATTVTADNINNVLDAYMDYIEACMPDALRQNVDWSEFTDLEREIDRMDDLDIEFYIYKNKLACIRTEIEGDDVELQFQGGDYRLQNMELLIDDTTYLKLEGEKDGRTETLKLKAAGQTVLKVEYDAKSGDFEIKADDESIEGNIASSRKGITVTVSEVSGMDGLELSLYALRSADFAKVDEKNTFDIGNADESDLQELIDDIDTGVFYEYGDLLDDIF
jgi:hypothetical protein